MKVLLVVNFTMDTNHPVLSHQIDIVEKLAPSFRKVIVLTANPGDYESHSNISICSTFWINGNPFRNLLNLYREFFRVLNSESVDVVFSHMTDVQSALLSPLTRLFRIKHYLWYAHKHKSRYLAFANFFVDGIITSTSGSCPIEGPKTYPVGQGVDSGIFQFKLHELPKKINFLHVGRFDSSKRIEKIIEFGIELRDLDIDFSLTLIGSPSNEVANQYSKFILSRYDGNPNMEWLTFLPGVRRSELPGLLHLYDVFVHAYEGSLDKTLIEATLCGLPVITTNIEYLQIFGCWGPGIGLTLKSEFLSFASKDRSDVRLEQVRRRQICSDQHSVESWISQVTSILTS